MELDLAEVMKLAINADKKYIVSYNGLILTDIILTETGTMLNIGLMVEHNQKKDRGDG